MSSAFKRVFLKDVYAKVDGNREEESVVWEGRGEVGDCSHLDTLSPARRTWVGGGGSGESPLHLDRRVHHESSSSKLDYPDQHAHYN